MEGMLKEGAPKLRRENSFSGYRFIARWRALVDEKVCD
jgi:hypothetical protein